MDVAVFSEDSWKKTMTDRLFLQGPQNLLAITVNGSVIVESEEERQRSETACAFLSVLDRKCSIRFLIRKVWRILIRKFCFWSNVVNPFCNGFHVDPDQDANPGIWWLKIVKLRENLWPLPVLFSWWWFPLIIFPCSFFCNSRTAITVNCLSPPAPFSVIPDPGSSGSNMNLKWNFSEKLEKWDNSSTKCSISQYTVNYFFVK